METPAREGAGYTRSGAKFGRVLFPDNPVDAGVQAVAVAAADAAAQQAGLAIAAAIGGVAVALLGGDKDDPANALQHEAVPDLDHVDSSVDWVTFPGKNPIVDVVQPIGVDRDLMRRKEDLWWHAERRLFPFKESAPFQTASEVPSFSRRVVAYTPEERQQLVRDQAVKEACRGDGICEDFQFDMAQDPFQAPSRRPAPTSSGRRQFGSFGSPIVAVSPPVGADGEPKKNKKKKKEKDTVPVFDPTDTFVPSVRRSRAYPVFRSYFGPSMTKYRRKGYFKPDAFGAPVL